MKLRLKTIEDGLKGQNTTKTEKSGKILGFLTSGGGGSKKRSISQPRGRIYALNQSIKRVEESDGKENSEITANGLIDHHEEDGKRKAEEDGNVDSEDTVSGFLYDRLQKEVIALRKICDSKDSTIIAKNEEIKVLVLVSAFQLYIRNLYLLKIAVSADAVEEGGCSHKSH